RASRYGAGMPDDNRRRKVSASKDKKGAQAGDAKNQKQRGPKEKLIRLDDLIPKQNVRGGRQLYFGSSDTETNNPTKKE
ncbi:MAG TPA: hypothetical protein VG095_09510, partial [Chthoniobacterales bacterium]|nr:hypothetical protein [Chthoniobacterales bacterium]